MCKVNIDVNVSILIDSDKVKMTDVSKLVNGDFKEVSYNEYNLLPENEKSKYVLSSVVNCINNSDDISSEVLFIEYTEK